MKSYRKELWFRVPSRRGLVNITGEVEKALEESGVQEGLVLVNAMNPVYLSTMMSLDFTGTWRLGWKSWRRKSPTASTAIMAMRTTPTPI